MVFLATILSRTMDVLLADCYDPKGVRLRGKNFM